MSAKINHHESVMNKGMAKFRIKRLLLKLEIVSLKTFGGTGDGAMTFWWDDFL